MFKKHLEKKEMFHFITINNSKSFDMPFFLYYCLNHIHSSHEVTGGNIIGVENIQPHNKITYETCGT